MCSSKTKKTAIDDFDKTTLDASVDMRIVFDCAVCKDNQTWHCYITQATALEIYRFTCRTGPCTKVIGNRPLYGGFWLDQGHHWSQHIESKVYKQLLAKTITQSIMTLFAYKSDRQASYMPKQASFGFRHQNENPQVVGLGLKVHQATRNKAEVDTMHRFGYSVSYEVRTCASNRNTACCSSPKTCSTKQRKTTERWTVSWYQVSKHHELSQAITERHERNIQKMKSVTVECAIHSNRKTHVSRTLSPKQWCRRTS